MKSIPLSLHKNYTSHWNFWEACREILQNSLDHGDYDVNYDAGKQCLHIISNGVALDEKVLLLGNGTKKKGDKNRGQYGEGFKLAMLVLLRNGYGLNILTGDKIWKPCFKHNEDFGDECLHVDVLKVENDLNLTDFVITGVTQEDVEVIAERYIPDSNYVKGELICENNGRFAFIQDKPSVYVGGLFVSHLPKIAGKPYKYSYNFNPQDVPLDRDRGTVDGFHVSWEAVELFRDSKKWDVLAELAIEEAHDISDHVSVGKSGRPIAEIKEMAKVAEKAFFKKHGSNAQPVDDSLPSEQKRLICKDICDQGYEPVMVKKSLYGMLSDRVTEQRVTGVATKPTADLLRDFLNEFNDLTDAHRSYIMDVIETEEIRHGKKG